MRKLIRMFTLALCITALSMIIYPATEAHAVSVKSVKLLSLKASSSGKITIKWKRQTGVSGYQIQYSEKSTFPRNKTITKTGITNENRTTSVTVVGKSGKTYYARVRGYKWSGNKQVFGSWSSKKSTTVKPADISVKSYKELVNAIRKVKNGQTIKVTKPIVTQKELTIYKPGIEFTIDFCGKPYKISGPRGIFIDQTSTVTLKNGNMSQDEIGSDLLYGLIENWGTLRIKGGSYVTPYSPIVNECKCTIEDGKFISTSRYSIYTGADSFITINAGKFSGPLRCYGVVNLKGGDFDVIEYRGSTTFKMSANVTYKILFRP